jgi:hypothetical protein
MLRHHLPGAGASSAKPAGGLDGAARAAVAASAARAVDQFLAHITS